MDLSIIRMIAVFSAMVILVSFLSCSTLDPRPAWQETLNYLPEEIHPITIGKYGYPYVRVALNGVEMDMAVDTANMTGLLVSTDLAERLKLPQVGQSKHYASSGAVKGISRVFRVDRLEMLGQVFEQVKAHEELQNDLDGLVGPRFFLEKRFTLDYENKAIALSATPMPENLSTGMRLPMIPSPELEGLILVHGTVKGQRVLIEVDTGKSRTCVDSKLAASLGLEKVPHGFRIDEIGFGSRNYSVRSAKEVNFRGISRGLEEPILLGIGSDILSDTLLTVDYAGGHIYVGR